MSSNPFAANLHPATAQERRASGRLRQYWEQLRGDADFPGEEAIDPQALRDFWDNCFLIQRRDIELVPFYNYTYIGGAIIRAYEAGVIPMGIPGLVTLDPSSLSGEYQRVIATRQPVDTEGIWQIDRESELRFRQTMIPLGNQEGEMIAILGQMNFRIYER